MKVWAVCASIVTFWQYFPNVNEMVPYHSSINIQLIVMATICQKVKLNFRVLLNNREVESFMVYQSFVVSSHWPPTGSTTLILLRPAAKYERMTHTMWDHFIHQLRFDILRKISIRRWPDLTYQATKLQRDKMSFDVPFSWVSEVVEPIVRKIINEFMFAWPIANVSK